MMMNIMGQILYKLATQDHKTYTLFTDTLIMIVPIVNLDTYTLISKKYDEGHTVWNHWNMLRKSRRPNSLCKTEDFGIGKFIFLIEI